jgi:hypothetical protein
MQNDGPTVTRGRLLAVTVPVLAATTLVWGLMAYVMLPGLPPL